MKIKLCLEVIIYALKKLARYVSRPVPGRKKQVQMFFGETLCHDQEGVWLSWAEPVIDTFILDFADIPPSQEEDGQACSRFFCVPDVTGGGETEEISMMCHIMLY